MNRLTAMVAAISIVAAGCSAGSNSDTAVNSNTIKPTAPLPAPLEDVTTTTSTTTTTLVRRAPVTVVDDNVPRLPTTTKPRATTTTTDVPDSGDTSTTTVPTPAAVAGLFLHENIAASVFAAGGDDGATAWNQRWSAAYGCAIDAAEPTKHEPADCEAGLNPFHVALPYNDIGEGGRKPDADLLTPWAGQPVGLWTSLLEGVWVEVTSADGKVSFGQWVDVLGDGNEAGYVLGEDRPGNDSDPQGSAIALSPRLAQALGMDAVSDRPVGVVSWRFVAAADVPDGAHNATGVIVAPY